MSAQPVGRLVAAMPLDPLASAARRAAIRRAANVLIEIAADIERLGGDLCSDPQLVAQHMDTLQAIDLIAQKQRAIADLLHAECPLQGIEEIGVEALREQLR